MKHVLVTGIGGFVGQHLAKSLSAAGCEVSGMSRETEAPEGIRALLADWHSLDLADAASLANVDLSPYDAIISLAGLAAIGQSFDEPELYKRVNVGVLSNLCERLLAQKLNPRIIAISTGAVYDSSQPLPLSEDSALATNASPYALSKIAMEKAAKDFVTKGLSNIVIARPFNHIGPGQNGGFIVPDMYQKIVDALAHNQSLVLTGNLETRRDYTDVRDVVRAYTWLALADKIDDPVYNVCSNTSHSGQEIVDELVKNIAGAEKLKFVPDSKLVRPTDPEVLVGSYDLLKKAVSWKPQIPFSQSMADFVQSKLL